jgi:hypothetical protein
LFTIIFEKPIDKSGKVWYNIIIERERTSREREEKKNEEEKSKTLQGDLPRDRYNGL